MGSAFCYFNGAPEVVCLTMMLYIRSRCRRSKMFERGIDICPATVRLWWNRFRPMFAAESDGGAHETAGPQR
jgi:putative transposase